MVYNYHINLNERGSFFADIRDDDENTVYEFEAGNELKEYESSIFDDGWMKHPEDIGGLAEYLMDIGIMKSGDVLVNAN